MNASTHHAVTFTLNGGPARLSVEPRTLATDAIRHQLGLTGTHVGCEHGVCGACTITVDGAPTRACLTLALQLEGAVVATVEGLSPERDALGLLQESFRRNHALHCGFCTAGILMSVDAFLRDHPDPDEAEIREVVGGHLCRCTGYTAIVKAVREAATAIRGAEHV